MKKTQWNVMIVGGGWYTDIHDACVAQFNGRSCTTKVNLVGAVLGKSDPIGRAEKWGVQGFADAEAAAAAASALGVDYALVATGNDGHAPCAVPFLKRKIPVLCEKPMAHNLAAAVQMAEASFTNNALLGQVYTYVPTFGAALAAEIISSGKLKGERPDQFVLTYDQGYERDCPSMAEVTSGPLAWRRGAVGEAPESNVEGDLLPHLLSLAGAVANVRVKELRTQHAIVLPDRKLPDNANVLAWSEEGTAGTLRVSQTYYNKGNPPSVYFGFPSAGLEFELGTECDRLYVTPKGKGRIELRLGAGLSGEEWVGDGVLDRAKARMGLGVGLYPDQHHLGLPRWLMATHYNFLSAIEAVAGGSAKVTDPWICNVGTAAFGLYVQRVIAASVASGRARGEMQTVEL